MPTMKAIQDEIANVLDVDQRDLDEDQVALLDSYLTMLATQETEKVDSFAQFVRFQRDHISAIRSESKRLDRRADSLERGLEYLVGSYIGLMKERELKKIKGNSYDISLRENPVVRIEKEADIPAEYWTVREDRKVNKLAIRDAIKEGITVPGATMGTTPSLIIR